MGNSKAYSSQSNGVVERGVQSVEGFIRVMTSRLEEKIKGKLGVVDAVWP